MKKLISISLILLSLLLCMSACNASYRDDQTAKQVADEMLAAINVAGGCTSVDSDYVSLEFPDADAVNASVSDWCIYPSTSSITVDELGVFHVKAGENVGAVKTAVEQYVQSMQVKLEVYLDTYDPAEKSKLENAQVFVYGNYVIYTMLSESDTAAVKSAAEALLKE